MLLSDVADLDRWHQDCFAYRHVHLLRVPSALSDLHIGSVWTHIIKFYKIIVLTSFNNR